MAGLYLHIPFCKSRCIYCDFYSSTSGEEVRRAYVDALCRELAVHRAELEGHPLETIYIGGGTPSLLSLAELEQLFTRIYSLFEVTASPEITLEVNPDDFSAAYAAALRSLPVNRVSMGVQTFDDASLRLLRRRHSAARALEAVERCVAVGISNISIDLIYGLPGQDMTGWEHDLETAFRLPITHLSAYALIYEEETALWKMREEGRVAEADEELSLRMFQALMDKVQGEGWEHYEISNFCKPGLMARHNTAYWTGERYVGCGPSAHSFNGRYRQWNRADLSAYIRCGGDVYARSVGEEPLAVVEPSTAATRYNDTVITALRMARGIDIRRMSASFGPDAVSFMLKCAAPHLRRGTLERTPPDDRCPEGTLRLTRKGIFLSDAIMSDLLMVD